ncbi:MAG: hypothetical protein KAS32_05280 [Candidatus Peribacteraceae bacterium]|nr:hypothetical protein [Candidatus Peribacteraceae bacterium]
MANLHKEMPSVKIPTMIGIILSLCMALSADVSSNNRMSFLILGLILICINGSSIMIDWSAVEEDVAEETRWIKVVKYFNSRYGEVVSRTEFLTAMGLINHNIESTWDKYRRLLARAGYLVIVGRGKYQLTMEINEENADILRTTRRLIDNVSEVDNKLPNFKFL